MDEKKSPISNTTDPEDDSSQADAASAICRTAEIPAAPTIAVRQQNDGDDDHKKLSCREKESLILQELSSTLHTLDNVTTVLEDIVQLASATNSNKKMKRQDGGDDNINSKQSKRLTKENTTSVAMKQQLLMRELDQWKQLLSQTGRMTRAASFAVVVVCTVSLLILVISWNTKAYYSRSNVPASARSFLQTNRHEYVATTTNILDSVQFTEEGFNDAWNQYRPRKLCAVTSGSGDTEMDSSNVLNVHLVPHTHDDVGWLKTVDEYYYGLNMTIQEACVRDILDTVVISLLKNPSRTFTYVEQKFFSMWWNEQSQEVKASVKYLIANNQLSFVNGGWCMHDEATTHFMGMIDQTTLGHQFLKQELNVIPKVGWQLDPFGHSATQASLLTAKAGMNALYFGRVDYQDLQIRRDTQECEGLWSASKTEGVNNTIFWGLTGEYGGQYECPKGFCFDVTCHDELLENLKRAELVEKTKTFVKELKVQSDRTKGNNIMITQGGDFTYRFAETFFHNNDILMQSIHVFQRMGLIDIPSMVGPRFKRINMFYSSPDYYTEMKHQETLLGTADEGLESSNLFAEKPNQKLLHLNGNINWTTKTDDFFPYSDCPHCFWVGYFTSRAGFKRLERVSSAFLLAARQIESLPEHGNATERLFGDSKPLYDLEDASGIAQHHDGVSGTAKQHVANDYSKRLQAGINKAANYVEQKLQRLLVNDTLAPNRSSVLHNLAYCQFLNETICKVSQEATKEDTEILYVIVYNALGSQKSRIVCLPVSSLGEFVVSRVGDHATGSAETILYSVPSAFPLLSSTAAKYTLAFDTGPLTPAGATVFRIIQSPRHRLENEILTGRLMKSRSLNYESDTTKGLDIDQVTVSNEFLTVQFNRSTGAILSIQKNDTTLNVSQVWGYYSSFDHSIDKAIDNSSNALQNSGAYIFRPSTPNESLHTAYPLIGGGRFVNTSVGIEVRTEFSVPWIQQAVRVMKGLPYVEIEYNIGPVPIEDGRGKEIVTKFLTSIDSSGTFFTDSNGREFLKRKRDYRPSWNLTVHEPVAGNYYPVNAAIYIEDNTTSFAVLTDRTQAGCSLSDGTVELMAQRRILADDNRGVAEPMNETNGGVTAYPPYGNATRWGEGVVIRGIYRIMVGPGNSGASIARSEMDHAFAPPLVFVASSRRLNNSASVRESLSLLEKALPANVMLITFQRLGSVDSNEYLVRLGHQYGFNDDTALSKPVDVDLATSFVGLKVLSVEELTLTGNQKLSDWLHSRLDWVNSSNPTQSSKAAASTNTTITLHPMEVRTFKIAFGNQILSDY